MATNFPTSVDNFTNPTANDSLNLPSHSTQHANANDAIEAIEGYLLTEPIGMRLVKTQTIGTGVSSVSVTNAFSATYDNYRILVSGGVGGSANADLRFQLTGVATGYYGSLIYSPYAGGAVNAVGSSNVASLPYMGVANLYSLSAQIEINAPFLTEQKMISGTFYDTVNTGRAQGICDSLASYTGFTLIAGAGTLTGGTIQVYGYTK